MASKHPLPPSPEEVTSPASKRQKKVACRRCHTHKIKCSGDQPCRKCFQSGLADDCFYESRDRKVNVNQSYIDQLLAENQRLKRQKPPSPENLQEDRPTSSENDQSDRNPLIGDRAWFHPYDPTAPPIYIGEAACTAFATRFRRFLTGDESAAHIHRKHYIDEDQLRAASQVNVPWPNLPRAQLLVKKAMYHVGRVYHMMLRKSTLLALKETYRTSQFNHPANTCKFFVLFALGEVYSTRTDLSTGQNIPGMHFYARALDISKVLPERPGLTHIEGLLLLSLFSYFLNRRHHAYILVGNAMRLGLAMGLNHNVPEAQMIDPVERQHRIRIWWSIYIFDRMWGSKMGIPMSILEEDIHVDLPSDVSPQYEHDEQFSDTAYMNASIQLARIAGDIIANIYRRNKSEQTFLQRVQKLLKSLKSWMETLPEHVRLRPDLNHKHVVSLHLSFNQCVILATRPTLLHVLTQLRKPDPQVSDQAQCDLVSQAAMTLADACIYAAQHSYSLILREWLNGSLPVYGYFYAQYLFSTALVLAMSTLKSPGCPNNDMESFATAAEILYSMRDNGNYAATEFAENLDNVRECVHNFLQTREPPHEDLTEPASGNIPANQHLLGTAPSFSLSVESGTMATSTGNEVALSMRNLSGDFTTEMAFLEPTMQAFLAQSDFDLGLLNPPVDISMGDNNSFYFLSNTPQWTG